MKHSAIAFMGLALAAVGAADATQLVDSHIQLASGRILNVEVISTLDPVTRQDPIYIQYDSPPGESTNPSKRLLVRGTFVGSTIPTAATALIATAAVLTGSATPLYVNTILRGQGSFSQVEVPVNPPLPPFDRISIAQAAIGLANLVGGSNTTSLVSNLAPTFGLPSPCGAVQGAACSSFTTKFDADATGRLLVMVSQNSGAAAPGAAVSLCISMGGLPAVQLTATTDPSGIATFPVILGAGDMIEGTRVTLQPSPGSTVATSCLVSGVDCSAVATGPGH